MKHLNKILVASVLTLCGGVANAVPMLLPADQPIVLKFSGNQQVSAVNQTVTYGTDTVTENAWGVFIMSTIQYGVVTNPNTSIGTDTSAAANIFNSSSAAQITAMFHGATAHNDSGNVVNAALASKGGYLDFYWRDASTVAGYTATQLSGTSGVTAAGRTGATTFTGITDGAFLFRLAFEPGLSNDPFTTIAGDASPNILTGFSGRAKSVGSIDLTTLGLWSEALDSNWLNTQFGVRDMKFANNYESLTSWNGNGYAGAYADDPASAMTVPEPESLVLLGMGLLGFAASRRKKA